MGNAIFPIMMMNALKDEVSEVVIQETTTKKEDQVEISHVMKMQDEVSIIDRVSEDSPHEIFYDSQDFLEHEEYVEADNERSESDQEEPNHERFYDFFNQKPRRQLRYRQRQKAALREPKPREMPTIQGKTRFLMQVNATDCIKDKISGRYVETIPALRNSGIKKMERELQKSMETEKVDVYGDPILTKPEHKKKMSELNRNLRRFGPRKTRPPKRRTVDLMSPLTLKNTPFRTEPW